MARDAQLGGDRVQTEYYLQYAEHYYRVLGESRARFEEQRRARGEDGDDGDDDEDDGFSDGGDDQQGRDDDRAERNDRPDRSDRPQRNERPQRSEGNDRPQRSDGNDRDRGDGGERYQRADRPERAARPPRYARNDGDNVDRNDGDTVAADNAPRPARPPRNANRGPGDGARPVESIAFDALPPAIGAPVAVAGDDEPAPPKRRVRKPRAAGDEGDIAPAA